MQLTFNFDLSFEERKKMFEELCVESRELSKLLPDSRKEFDAVQNKIEDVLKNKKGSK